MGVRDAAAFDETDPGSLMSSVVEDAGSGDTAGLGLAGWRVRRSARYAKIPGSAHFAYDSCACVKSAARYCARPSPQYAAGSVSAALLKSFSATGNFRITMNPRPRSR